MVTVANVAAADVNTKVPLRRTMEITKRRKKIKVMLSFSLCHRAAGGLRASAEGDVRRSNDPRTRPNVFPRRLRPHAADSHRRREGGRHQFPVPSGGARRSVFGAGLRAIRYRGDVALVVHDGAARSEEHTSELQS